MSGPHDNLLILCSIILVIIATVIEPCSSQVNQTTAAPSQGVINDNIGDVSIYVSPTKQIFSTTYVPANTALNLTASHEPSNDDSKLIYEWSTKDGPIQADKHAKTFFYKFTKSDQDNFIQVNVSDPTTKSYKVARVDVTVKSPVSVSDPAGKLFLEKGEMLDISLVYSGSPPFQYCYKFCGPYDILPCEFCLLIYETTDTKIPIRHYLHNVGNYSLMFKIQNIMNYEQRQFAIKINDTVRKSNLPIAPIVSSILAVCILLTGVALHMRFKDTSYSTETANFDFFHDNDEEWEQELSFIQRVRYLFCGAEPDEIDEAEGESRLLLQKKPQNGTTPLRSNGSSQGRY